MEHWLKVPDDVFKHHIVHYLTLNDIVSFDNACTNHKCRQGLMDFVRNVIMTGDINKMLSFQVIRWLCRRGIYLQNIYLTYKEYMRLCDGNHQHGLDMLRYHLLKHCTGVTIGDRFMLVVISQELWRLSSHHHHNATSRFKLSDVIIDYEIKEDDLLSLLITKQCTRLQSLDVSFCYQLIDASIISISSHCTGLQSLNVSGCDLLSDASIISISSHCTGLQSLNVSGCNHLTDASIISISTHCSGLQLLIVSWCNQLTDASIISISVHCTRLQSLDLSWCEMITDSSIISISTHCTRLQSLDVSCCEMITDASIMSISRITIIERDSFNTKMHRFYEKLRSNLHSARLSII